MVLEWGWRLLGDARNLDSLCSELHTENVGGGTKCSPVFQ